ncbi:MAG: NUDIX hydrolase [Intestinimonas sp.]|jgi:8-oxo-dGTP pyrophosphatase MutT (NUDIX family)|nr:NUDIX hydrolase [Intestinimonas sp.]
MELIKQLEDYSPFNAQEEKDRAELLRYLRTEPDCFTRKDHTAHITASAWVVNPCRDRVLMVYHNIYHSWSWLGGHADGDRNLLTVAVREVQEESGLCHVRPVTDNIFSVEILTVDGHEKRGTYISSHLHLNVTYLLEADEMDPLRAKPDENSGVAWFGLEEAVAASSEPWFQARIYRKLNKKLLLLERGIHADKMQRPGPEHETT